MGKSLEKKKRKTNDSSAKMNQSAFMASVAAAGRHNGKSRRSQSHASSNPQL